MQRKSKAKLRAGRWWRCNATADAHHVHTSPHRSHDLLYQNKVSDGHWHLEQHIVCDVQYAVINIAPNATWDSPAPTKENRFSTSVTPSSNEQSVTGVPTTNT